MKALIAWLLLVQLACVQLACAQRVLLPVYDADLGVKVLNTATKEQKKQLTIIVNPNSGPAKDPGMFDVVKRANKDGVRVVFYIDLLAIPGDGLTPSGGKERAKTSGELNNERSLYSKFYGKLQWDGWFFDDVNAKTQGGVRAVQDWPLEKIFNPGTAWVPPGTTTVIISEQAKAWPRKLTAWELSHRGQCGVIGLKISDIDEFLATTKGFGFIYASERDDKWTNNQSAYTMLTKHFNRLFK